jgi:hypothetical protein
MKTLAIRLLTAIRMGWTRFAHWRPFIAMTKDPMRVQQDLLGRILKYQLDTDFGRQYRFDEIVDYSDFAERVPVNDYEQLRPYIEIQENSKKPGLNREQPLIYAQTSGTTGKPKIIPITRNTIRRYRHSQRLVAYSIYRYFPEAYHGRILAIVSAAEEGRLDTGTVYGAMSGLIYRSMPKLMRRKYVLDPEVFEIEDYQEKYYRIALQSMLEPNISMIATANPSTLLKLASIINGQFDSLAERIMESDEPRANRLIEIFTVKSKLTFSDIWPRLRAVVTWTGGSCSALIPELKNQVTEETRIVELGYLSSEFRGSITIDPLENLQIPCIHETFFEFVEASNWESGTPRFLTLDQLQPATRYYVFATTQNGLYRYDINDLIEVTGYFNQTPTIRFLQKGKGVVSLTGEKLYESQLVEAINRVKDELQFNCDFFIMLGDAKTLEYTLYLECSEPEGLDIDRHLGLLNIEYRSKRDSGRLKPLQTRFLRPGSGDTYKQYCLDQGQREGQFKTAVLQNREDCDFNFDEFSR